MSSISSLAKFSNALGSAKDETAKLDDPTDLVLKLLRGGMVPVSDLADQTKLSNEVLLDTIEKLRAVEKIEILEIPSAANRKFVRLTPAGYSSFAS